MWAGELGAVTAASICPIATARFAPPARVFRNGSCRSFVGPDEGAGEGDRCLVAGGVLVVAGGDASPLLETVEVSFDDVAAPVGGLVEYTGPFPAPGQARELVDTFRDGGVDAAPVEVGAEGPGGVALVRDDPLGPQAGSPGPSHATRMRPNPPTRLPLQPPRRHRGRHRNRPAARGPPLRPLHTRVGGPVTAGRHPGQGTCLGVAAWPVSARRAGPRAVRSPHR